MTKTIQLKTMVLLWLRRIWAEPPSERGRPVPISDKPCYHGGDEPSPLLSAWWWCSNATLLLVAFLFGSSLTGVIFAAVHDPATELASFQVEHGFEVNLFASEKEGVVKPIQMRFDARGRLWVIGSTVYPQIEPGQIPNDKIIILEDSDNDGRADKTTIFADGLMIPTGIELSERGAYVGHGTELLFLRDNNGDGKADERRVVMRGFGTGDNHQNINSFRWGPGGELWMSQGLHTRSRVETPWGIVRVDQAGLWRFRPRLMRLDGFYGSEHEPQNPWGFVFTRWGEPIVLAGNNSSPIYPVPGLVANRRHDPPALIWKNGGGRKVSGGEIVETAHFPESWQGALIMGGYINNAIWTVKIKDDGAGFLLEDLPPLIKSTDRSFRPVDVRFGPDGALYICDWFNPIIGHYQASFRHPDRDKTHGRIWRVTAKGRLLTPRPELESTGTMPLLEKLKSKDGWTRHFTKRVLADRPKGEVIRALNTWTSNPNLSEHELVEALGVYQSHEQVASNLVGRLARAHEPDARAYAASAIGRWADRLENPLDLLRALVADADPRVRLHAVVACTWIPKAESIEVATISSDFPTDKFLTYALNQAVFSLKPYWLPALRANTLNLDEKISRLELLVKADASQDTLETIRQMLANSQLKAATREMFLRLLAENGGAKDLDLILKQKDPRLLGRLLPTVVSVARIRNIRPTGEEEVLRSLVENPEIAVQAEGWKLAGIWKQEKLRPQALSRSRNDKTPEIVRKAIIEALGLWGGEESKNLLIEISRKSSGSLQTASLQALAGLKMEEAAQISAEALSQPQHDTAVGDIFALFLNRQKGAEVLARALEGKVLSKLVAEKGLEVMNASGRRNPSLAHLLASASGQASTPLKLSVEQTSSMVAEVKEKGNASRGAEIYRRPTLGCVACHLLNGEGGKVGPDLSSLGTAQPIDFIIGAILDPQKEVKEGFVSIAVVTKDGEEWQGFQVRETPSELVVRDVLQNKEVRLARSEIKEKKQIGSVMPEGLAETLSREEFRDLVRYLSELGRVK